MKRPLWPILLLLLLAAPRAAGAEVEVLATTYPMFLFTRNILAGAPDSRVTLLVGAPGCPHDYAPTPAELERLSQAEIIVSGGLALDSFLERALGVAKPRLKIIDATGGPAAADNKAAPVIILDPESARAWYRGRAQSPPTADPHFFASPSGAMVMAGHIAEGLARIDPQGAELYRANAAAFKAELKSLLEKFWASGVKLHQPRVILSHGVLTYLAADLGLNVVAVIEGEDEAPVSAARLSELAVLAGREDVRAILADPDGRLDLARTLGAEAGLPVAVIDPVTSGPDDPPPDYFQKVFLTDLEVLDALFRRPPDPPVTKPRPARRP
jgi:ABC-type Zn uptake system ZnuABC Zn-binding protein ZnuA